MRDEAGAPCQAWTVAVGLKESLCQVSSSVAHVGVAVIGVAVATIDPHQYPKMVW